MSKFQVKWGMLATGGIAETFGRDILLNPDTRGVHDVEHVVVAAAASSSQSRARIFLDKIGAPETAVAYGSYKELAQDPNLDIIYIATPHSHHFQHCMLCLESGKNVLCEKPFTTNAEQLEVLIRTAKEKNLFLMEAVGCPLYLQVLPMLTTLFKAWTRYFPLSLYVREQVTSGAIGTVYRTFADLSMISSPEALPDSHRLVSPDLAGGVLMDTGIYALTWVFQTLFTTQQIPAAPAVLSALRKYRLGTDEQVSMLLTFPRRVGGDAHGIATAGVRTATDPDEKSTAGPAVRIQGSHPAFRPTKTKLICTDGGIEEREWPQPGPGPGSSWYNGFRNEVGGVLNQEGEGHGMFWEADECAFALRDGRKESQHHTLAESLVIMQVMDQVRKQNGIRFPGKIETAIYPVDI